MDRQVRAEAGGGPEPAHGTAGGEELRPSAPEGLEAELARHLRADGARYGLAPASIRTSAVLNPGGFTNRSFRVTDGATCLHVKLATTGDGLRSLRKWHQLDPVLRRYRAPPVLGWIELEGAVGLVFPCVDGGVPALGPDVLHPIVDVLDRLWADRDLFARLGGEAVVAGDAYLATYHDRFLADLEIVAAGRPPFVSAHDLGLMEGEVRGLAEEVGSREAFGVSLESPVHGDLWSDNLLWQGPGRWYVLDWDDLQVGDPAMDLVMLTGPSPDDPAPLKLWGEIEGRLSPELRDRARVLARASLLDWVVDPLADWVDADAAPVPAARVRTEKERIHRAAWELYRRRYLP